MFLSFEFRVDRSPNFGATGGGSKIAPSHSLDTSLIQQLVATAQAVIDTDNMRCTECDADNCKRCSRSDPSRCYHCEDGFTLNSSYECEGLILLLLHSKFLVDL